MPERPEFSNSIEGVNKPKTPETSQQTEYQFNLGLYRIETLNNILEVCARRYKKAITTREAEDIREYQAIVNTLYTEAYIYMEEETGIEIKEVEQNKDEVLDKILDKKRNYGGEEDRMEHLKEIREIYLSVRSLLKAVHLDIPREEKIGETDLFTQT